MATTKSGRKPSPLFNNNKMGKVFNGIFQGWHNVATAKSGCKPSPLFNKNKMGIMCVL
jgi:hypothetical protein